MNSIIEACKPSVNDGFKRPLLGNEVGENIDPSDSSSINLNPIFDQLHLVDDEKEKDIATRIICAKLKSYFGHTIARNDGFFYLERKLCNAISPDTRNGNQLILIKGKQGSGKSTFLKFCFRVFGAYQWPSSAFSSQFMDDSYFERIPPKSQKWTKLVPICIDLANRPDDEDLFDYLIDRILKRLQAIQNYDFTEVEKEHRNLSNVGRLKFIIRTMNSGLSESRQFPVLACDNGDMRTPKQIRNLIVRLYESGLIISDMLGESGTFNTSMLWRLILPVRDETLGKIFRTIQSMGDSTESGISIQSPPEIELIKSRRSLSATISEIRQVHFQNDHSNSKISFFAHDREVHVTRCEMDLFTPDRTASMLKGTLNVGINDDEDTKDLILDEDGGVTVKTSKVYRLFTQSCNGSARDILFVWSAAVLGKIVRNRMNRIELKEGEPFRVTAYYFLCSIFCLETESFHEASTIKNLYRIAGDESIDKKEYGQLLVGHYGLMILIEENFQKQKVQQRLEQTGFSDDLISRFFRELRTQKLMHETETDNDDNDPPFVFERRILLVHSEIFASRAYIDTAAVSMAGVLGLGEITNTSADDKRDFARRASLSVSFLRKVLDTENLFCKKKNLPLLLSSKLIPSYEKNLIQAKEALKLDSLEDDEGKMLIGTLNSALDNLKGMKNDLHD